MAEAMVTIWRKLWAGPKCGASVPFPPGEPFLPVSRDGRKDDCDLYRVGAYLHDWTGELVGHYHFREDTGRAEFMELSPQVRGLYTRWNQADGGGYEGEDGG